MKPIDPIKVKDFLAKLNNNVVPSRWVELEGVSSLMKTEIKDDGQIVFSPTEGHLVKGFLDVNTGEIKLITARRFLKD